MVLPFTPKAHRSQAGPVKLERASSPSPSSGSGRSRAYRVEKGTKWKGYRGSCPHGRPKMSMCPPLAERYQTMLAKIRREIEAEKEEEGEKEEEAADEEGEGEESLDSQDSDLDDDDDDDDDQGECHEEYRDADEQKDADNQYQVQDRASAPDQVLASPVSSPPPPSPPSPPSEMAAPAGNHHKRTQSLPAPANSAHDTTTHDGQAPQESGTRDGTEPVDVNYPWMPWGQTRLASPTADNDFGQATRYIPARPGSWMATPRSSFDGPAQLSSSATSMETVAATAGPSSMQNNGAPSDFDGRPPEPMQTRSTSLPSPPPSPNLLGRDRGRSAETPETRAKRVEVERRLHMYVLGHCDHRQTRKKLEDMRNSTAAGEARNVVSRGLIWLERERRSARRQVRQS